MPIVMIDEVGLYGVMCEHPECKVNTAGLSGVFILRVTPDEAADDWVRYGGVRAITGVGAEGEIEEIFLCPDHSGSVCPVCETLGNEAYITGHSMCEACVNAADDSRWGRLM